MEVDACICKGRPEGEGVNPRVRGESGVLSGVDGRRTAEKAAERTVDSGESPRAAELGELRATPSADEFSKQTILAFSCCG